MPRKEQATGYSAMALARRLILQRGEVTRMGSEGKDDAHRRLPEAIADSVVEALDEAIEGLFISWLDFKAEKRGKPCEREKWDRTKWEKKLVVGMAADKYKLTYLQRAELHEGAIWDKPNFGG